MIGIGLNAAPGAPLNVYEISTPDRKNVMASAGRSSNRFRHKRKVIEPDVRIGLALNILERLLKFMQLPPRVTFDLGQRDEDSTSWVKVADPVFFYASEDPFLNSTYRRTGHPHYQGNNGRIRVGPCRRSERVSPLCELHRRIVSLWPDRSNFSRQRV